MAYIEIPLPIKGFSEGLTVDKSVPATSGYMNNVRIGVIDKKIRIAQRPAVVKWGAGTQIGGTQLPVAAMCTVSTVT